jgi:hypothetical protein
VNSSYSHRVPLITSFLAQVEPLGAAGRLQIPFDTEFEVAGGPMKKKYSNWVGYSTDSLGKEVIINLQGT